jgi:hypothetical protein
MRVEREQSYRKVSHEETEENIFMWYFATLSLWRRIGKDLEGDCSGLVAVLYQNFSGATEENYDNLSRDSLCPVRDSNRTFPHNVTARPTCSVRKCVRDDDEDDRGVQQQLASLCEQNRERFS